MNAINVKIKRLHPDAVIPQYATDGSAGFDLVAIEDVIIAPGETKLVRTGLAFEIPQGYEMQIRPRSGISLKTKLRVGNSPGTVDWDFRGEVCVIIDNIAQIFLADGVGPALKGFAHYIDGTELYSEKFVHDTYIIRRGDRIAQAIIAPVYHAVFAEVDELSETERGEGGFGSSGLRVDAKDSEKECPDCYGMGKIKVGPEKIWADCPKCSGEGYYKSNGGR